MTAAVYSQTDAVAELGRRGLAVNSNLVSYLMRDPLRRIPSWRIRGANLLDDEGLDQLEAHAREYLDGSGSARSA